MALSFLTNSGNASSAKFFDIRLDETILALRGTGDEASSALLKGTVVLCLSEPLRIQDIHLRFTGESRIGFPSTSRSGNYAKQQRTFLKKSWHFFNPENLENKGKVHPRTLSAGNYEYPFSFIIQGDMPESVEGLADSWVIYRLKATIERSLLTANVQARKHVRVIRTFDPSALELAHAMSVENVWTDKIQYSLSTPSKAVIFGSAVAVDFVLIPLLKGLKIGQVTLELVELQDVSIDGPYVPRQSHISRVVVGDKWRLPDDAETEDIEGQEGYKFTRLLLIPRSLRDCVQSVEATGIRVKHRLQFMIQLLNPDGHVSELRATLPIHIFISPNLPLDDNNDLINQQPQSLTTSDISQSAPPGYGDHTLDQLYSEVDLNGYMTPANASGGNTPFYAQSGAASEENLAPTNITSSNNISASILHHRLNSIQNTSSSRMARDRVYDPDGPTPVSGSSEAGLEIDHHLQRQNTARHVVSANPRGNVIRPHYSNPSSRRGSDEDHGSSGAHTPQHIELNVDDLSRVPSYGTALKTPLRGRLSENLPNYQTAMSRPLSPQTATLQPPIHAHTTRHSPDGSARSAILPVRPVLRVDNQ